MDKKTILVTGANGYIASRLIPRLLEQGYRVRCLARHPERLRQRNWYARVEMVAGDVTRPETLPGAMENVGAAYYLIHSMAAGHGYEHLDLQSARNFARAAKTARVGHIIYLGALADEREELALHLKSRIETGAVLREAGVPVTEFRAGIIVGPGSVSFEMIRFIAEQFPLMVGPLWLRHTTQPIATLNVLDYLMAALERPAPHDVIIEIGGRDRMTYAESMSRFAELRGLKRGMLLLPVVPVWLMAFMVAQLTPVHRSYALPLIQGLKNNSAVNDLPPDPTSAHAEAASLFANIVILDYAEAVRRCLADLKADTVERTWLDLEQDRVRMKHEGMFIDYLRLSSSAPAQAVFAAVCRIGGSDGWPGLDWAWQLRGWMDRVLGGPGMAGRDEPLRAGGRLDFYRVEEFSALAAQDTPGKQRGLLRLRAALKVPGDGWMEWKVTALESGCLLEQTIFFAPRGLPGFLYWYLNNPIHRLVFDRLAQALVRSAEGA